MDAEVGIGAAAAQAGVSIKTLRYYESAGLLPPIPRDAGGRRILRSQTVLGTDNDTPVPPQPWDNGQQTVETTPHDEPSPVQ